MYLHIFYTIFIHIHTFRPVILFICVANKGFWAELLGFGDFYYELAVQIVEICYQTRNQNGGLIDLNDLKQRLESIRPKAQSGKDISE